jgi:hypothetical protein
MVAAPNALQLVVNHLQSLDFKDTFDGSGVAVSRETEPLFSAIYRRQPASISHGFHLLHWDASFVSNVAARSAARLPARRSHDA